MHIEYCLYTCMFRCVRINDDDDGWASCDISKWYRRRFLLVSSKHFNNMNNFCLQQKTVISIQGGPKKTIFERLAWNNWYFRYSTVSLILCKEYLNMSKFRVSFLLLINTPYWYSILVYWTPSYVIIYRWSYTRSCIWSVFWPTLYI